MKKFYNLKLVLTIIFVGSLLMTASGQAWKQNLPANKSGNITFFDYQKAFNDYWAPYNVVDGWYLNEDGKKVKAGGWKQFKRWEYYWKTRVDNTTGEFPNTTAWEVWQDYTKTLPAENNAKSLSGNWITMGPANLDREDLDGALQENGTGRLNCMAFDPVDDNHFWVGAPAGGVWESTDGGATWACLTDDNPIIGVSVIALPTDYDKATNPTMYIGTGDRDAVDDPSIGVLKTTDGGATWNTTGLTFGASENTRIGGLVCSESDPNSIVAATFKGIFKSTDAGVTWTNMQSGLFIDMDKIPGTNTLIATTIGSPAAYRSTDFGSTWTNVWTGVAGAGGEYRCDVATTGADPSTVYLITDYYDTESLYGIYKSTDGGASFNQVYDGLTSNNLYGWDATNTEADGGQGWYDVAFAVSNANPDVVYVGGVNGFISTNGAVSFTVCNGWAGYVGVEVVHADHHNAYFRPSDDRLFDVNDGGVYWSDNVTLGGSATFTEITDGIITGQIYDLGISQDADGYIVAGFQDNGTKLLHPAAGILGWNQVKGGDGMCCAIDPTNFNTQWGTYVQLQVDRTTNLWGSASSLRSSGGAAWAGPLEVDPQGVSSYIGTDAVEWDVSKGAKPPGSYTGLSQSLDATNFLSALEIFNDGTDKMIWTASPSGCWKSPLGGSGTYVLLSNLPSNAVTDIAIDDNDYNHVYVCFGGYDATNVYETTDGGTSWTDISAGLPAVPTGAIVINEANTTAHEVYVGTDAGIYVKLGGAPWQLFNTGMPFVSITDMEIYYGATTDIYVSTYGRGIWKGDCYEPPALDLAIASIVEPVTEYCDPGTFTPTVTISNIGSTTITDATIEYSLDAGAPVSQVWSGSLVQGASTNVTFPAISILLGTHTMDYEIVSRNGSGTDESAVNDVKSTSYALWNHDMPYTQDFDAFPLGGNTNNYDGSPVALSECWVNETGDDIDWSVNSGVSPSGGTGPSSDHTSGSGVYLYTESSGPNGNKNLQVSSPVIDLTNYTSSQVTFWYHMMGANMGSLQIDLFYGGSSYAAVPVYWESLGATATSISGDQVLDQWFQATIDISAADGTNDLVVTFNATTGADYLSELAIDDFSVTGTLTAACTPPTTQATVFSATPSINSIDLSWTRGDGDRVLVVAHEASAVDSDPVSGTTYTANATFGSGTQIGTGNYVVYDGLSTVPSVTVTGLTASTTYYFAVYEFNSADHCYLTPGLTGNSTTNAAATYNWTGAGNSDWQNTGNWSSSIIPTSTDDVTIPTGMPNYPIIDDGATVAECNNLTIDAGGSVTIAVNGDMTVSGTITNNAGNTGLVINSDATGTGSLIQNTSGGVDATVNCFLAASPRQFHMIGSPIATAPISNLPTTTNLYWYDESTADYWTGATYNTGSSSGWTNITSGNMLLNTGYLINYYENTVTYTGSLNDNTTTGTINLSYTDNGVTAPNSVDYNDFDGWNFISNPYTSAIDWEDAGINHLAADLDNGIYYYDGTQYTSWVGGVGTNGGTQYIPAMQGFFVKANSSSGALTIPASARVHNDQAYWKSIYTTPENLIKIKIESNGISDETIVRFKPDATNNADKNYDAYKLFSHEYNIFQIYTNAFSTTEYTINTLPDLSDATVIIPIKLINIPATYTLSASEFNFTNAKVFLIDNVLQTETELTLGSSFNITNSENGDADRFTIKFVPLSSLSSNIAKFVSIYPNPNDGNFNLSVSNFKNQYQIEITDIAGKIIYKNISDKLTQVLSLSEQTSGIYFIKVTFDDKGTIVKKIFVK